MKKRISSRNHSYQPDPILVIEILIQKALSNFIDFPKAKGLNLNEIPWTKIASKINTKSKDDCRNKWYVQVMNTIHDSNEFTKGEQKRLVKGIQVQDVSSERDIDFDLIDNGRSGVENTHYWEKLKKLVGSRYLMDVNQTLIELAKTFKTQTRQQQNHKYTYGESSMLTDQDNQPNLGNIKPVNRITLMTLFKEKMSS